MKNNDLSIHRFAELATLYNGRAYLMPELQESGKYRIVRVGNFTGKDEWYYSDLELTPEKYCEKGDLLFKWACTFGPEIWKEEKAIYHYHIWKVVPNPTTDRIFLYYYLRFATPHWIGATNGATMVHITKTSMEKKKVLTPNNVAVQKRIADILFAYDSLIEVNNRRIKILEQMAENLFREWFVRFRFPGYETAEFENGSPTGWHRTKLGNLVSFQNGFAFRSEEYDDNGQFIVVTIKNVQDGYLDLDSVERIDYFPRGMPQYCILKKGEVLMSLTGNVGRVCIVSSDNCLLNQRVGKVVCKYPYFAYLLFMQDTVFQMLCNIAYGTAQLNLSPVLASKMKILLPPDRLMSRYNKAVSSLFDEIQKCNEQIENLQKQRDLLLPRLMSDKLEV